MTGYLLKAFSIIIYVYIRTSSSFLEIVLAAAFSTMSFTAEIVDPHSKYISNLSSSSTYVYLKNSA